MTWLASLFIVLFSLFPPWVSIIAMAMITFVTIVIIIKIIAFVLDAIPFL